MISARDTIAEPSPSKGSHGLLAAMTLPLCQALLIRNFVGGGRGLGVRGRLFKFAFSGAKFWARICFGWVGVWRLRTPPLYKRPALRCDGVHWATGGVSCLCGLVVFR